MKTIVALFMITTATTIAKADGFVCRTTDQDLSVKVYNNTQPEAGTRTAAVMVLADPNLQEGRKTIARFTDVKGTLESSGPQYVANVDLRFSDSNLGGKLISGTKLGQLDTVTLDVDFSYAHPVADGTEVSGQLTLAKRNGDVIERQMECIRYLKN